MPKGRPGKVKWTPEQEQMIRDMYATLGPDKLAERMGVDKTCLMNRAGYLGLRKYKPASTLWTEEMEQKILAEYGTKGPSVLAKEMGITPEVIVGKARRLGIPPKRGSPDKIEWTEEMIEAIRLRYEEEGPWKLAEEFGFKFGRVREMAYKLGLHSNAGHKRWGRERAETSTSCDIHYFDAWSDDIAYVLGFLFADGNVNKDLTGVTIILKKSDISALRFIREQLKVKAKIHIIPGRLDIRTGNVCEDGCRLNISSKVLVESLLRLGLKPRKTYNDDPFPTVPEQFLPHFLRGVFDGDGSACQYKDHGYDAFAISFCGSPKFITAIRDELVLRLEISPRKVGIQQGKETSWAYVLWTRREDHKKLFHFLYPDGFSFCLKRKWKRIVRWLKE